MSSSRWRTPRASRPSCKRRRRRRDLPLLRGRRARVLQRHQPPRHLRRRAGPALMGAHGRLPALGARVLSTAASCATAFHGLSRPTAALRARGRALGAVVLAGLPARTAAGGRRARPRSPPAAPWSRPAALSDCAAVAPARVVFPSDRPDPRDGPRRDRLERRRRLPRRRRGARRERSARRRAARARDHPAHRCPRPLAPRGPLLAAAPPTARS